MLTVKFQSQIDLTLWQKFVDFYRLNEIQQRQFGQYIALLIDWNKKHNITSITEPYAIILDHFWDSLSLTKVMDVKTIASLADIGAGGGFPSVPIKIMYPHLKLFLIEVNQKKIAFLEELARHLELSDVRTCPIDWRTFLRKTSYPIELFVARASLSMAELLRLFRPSSIYQDAKLVYWASEYWQPTEEEKQFFIKCHEYQVGNKTRRLIIFAKK